MAMVGERERVLDWLLDSNEPAARWIALTALQDRPRNDRGVVAAHQAVVGDAATGDLIDRLGDWDLPVPLGGHDSAAYAPNLLGLLADMGLETRDSARIDAILDAMAGQQDPEGRLATPAIIARISPDPVLSTLLCDSHAILEVLVRFGRADDPTVRRGLDRMAADLCPTPQGRGWTCLPSQGFRGPGRKGDVCPQVTLEAVRTFGRLPHERRPDGLPEAVRTVLRVWAERATAKPYMFGHGIAFKTIKWPPFWYGVLPALEAVAMYPELWRGDGSRPDDRRAVTELVACLRAYNMDANGLVTPRSCYRGFERHSFGQKKHPSPFATARVHAVLRPFDDLAQEVEAVDVGLLGSSKGGTGAAVPPRLPGATA